MKDVAPYQDELREAELDARVVAVFFDAPDDRPTLVEIERDENDLEVWR